MLRFDASFSLENYKIIPPPTYEFSFSEIKISPKSIFFSATTVSELSYTPNVAFFFSPESCVLVVVPSGESDYSCPFYEPGQNRKNVTIQHEQLTAAIRATMSWPARKGTYRIPGVRAPNSSQPMLCFDLALGSCTKKTTRKIDPKTVLSGCPTIQEMRRPNSKFIPFGLPPASTSSINTKGAGPETHVVEATCAVS